MPNDRWEQIKRVFDAALRRPADARGAFLDKECGDDDAVRSEVESLLASFENADGFMQQPIVGEAAFSTLVKNVFEKGRVLGHYEIVEKIGAGGMGEVYLAQDKRLNRRVALKVLPSASATSDEAHRRLWVEARAAATLDHPNICAIHEIAETGDHTYIVMQYVEGEPLSDRIRRRELTQSEAIRIAVQIADALDEAHSRRIIHRDIKPANIILNSKGQVKVLDFGLAKFADGYSGDGDSNALSKSGAVMGTVPYMSPEQVRRSQLDARTDIFSLGATLYEMLSGRSPFARETDAETISAILRDDPAYEDLSGSLRPILEKALAKSADDRYESAKALLLDLQQLESSGELSTPDSSASRSTAGTVDRVTSADGSLIDGIKRHKLASASVLTVLLAVTAVGIWFGIGRSSIAEKPPARSIAILPLRSINAEANDQYLGLGISDSIIAKSSQIDGLTVRPISAVRKYLNAEIDSLEAAREQKVETVLDGTIQRSGDRLRVSVNLLNVNDGTSIWAETFNLNFNDIFQIQDEISRQIASRLRLKLSESEIARIAKRNTSNADAYNYYAKAMYHFYSISADPKTRHESDLATDLFQKAIELDTDYALARAYLGYTFTKIAVFQEENVDWIAKAKEQLAAAEKLNPTLAEVHVARYFIAFSQYEGWKIETAFRELRLAQEIDPDTGHAELADLCAHVGLEDRAIEEFEAALRIDPNNDSIKGSYIILFAQANRPDFALELSKRFFDRGPNAQYYVEKMMPKEAEQLIEQELAKDPSKDPERMGLIQVRSLQGRHDEAQAAASEFLATVRKNRGYHHYAYYGSRVFAQAENTSEALKWLRYSAENGAPSYPLFERDRYLDPIRSDPKFIAFLAEMKERWERYQRQFA